MLIALLALIGVDLIVIVVLLAVVLSRKRWISHHPGAFKGAIRIIDGEVPGLGKKWKHGYARWVRDILVWTKAPFLFRNELIPADSLIADPRPAEPGEVKRLGKHPTLQTVAVEGGARVLIASADGPARALGPFEALSDPGPRSSDEQTPVNHVIDAPAPVSHRGDR